MTEEVLGALLPAAIIAVTELVKRVRAKDWNGASTIVVAAIVGVAAGFLGVKGLDPAAGALAGLEAVGIVKTAQTIRN